MTEAPLREENLAPRTPARNGALPGAFSLLNPMRDHAFALGARTPGGVRVAVKHQARRMASNLAPSLSNPSWRKANSIALLSTALPSRSSHEAMVRTSRHTVLRDWRDFHAMPRGVSQTACEAWFVSGKTGLYVTDCTERTYRAGSPKATLLATTLRFRKPQPACGPCITSVRLQFGRVQPPS